MGARLAQRAALEPVGEDAKCVLLVMALMALDTPKNGQPAAVYWGGHEYLMQVAFNHIAERGTSEYDQAARRIRRRITKLTDAGSIRLLQASSRRTNARYELALPATAPVDNVHPLPERRSPSDLLNGHAATSKVPEWRSSGDQKGGHPATSVGVSRRQKR